VNANVSVLVTPHAGLHYLEPLYREIESSGVKVRFAKGPTPSQTLNIALSPAVLTWYRILGYQVLHIHWVFQFSLPWARERKWARHLMELWFGVYLRTAQALGYSIVWTAHDLLPHGQIFADDLRARDLLLSKARAVIALSESTAVEVIALGAQLVRVIPIGPYTDHYPVKLTREEARSSFGFSDDDLVVALIGRIEEYKGADLLLKAVAELPKTSKIKVLLVGSCSDPTYRRKIDNLASQTDGRTLAVLDFVPDEDLARYYQATDFAVFPFREITNSASVLLAQSFARPIVIPDLPFLRDIPAESAIRFDSTMGSLVNSLRQAEDLSESQYRKMSAAGLAWATRFDWSDVAQETIKTYRLARSS